MEAEQQIEIEIISMNEPKNEKNNEDIDETEVLMNQEKSSSHSISSKIRHFRQIGDRSDRCKKCSVYLIPILALIGVTVAEYVDTNRNKYKVIVSVSTLTLLWEFISVLYALYMSNQVYRIRVYTKQLSETQAITIPYKVIHYPTIPCGSISEFSATRGSPYYMMFLVTCTLLSWMLITVTIFEEFKTNVTTANRFFSFGCIGLFSIGIWELHPEDILHVVFHYIGTLGMLCYGIAYGLQSDWSIDSIVFILCGLLFWILWICLKMCNCAPIAVKESDDTKAVKRTSAILIVVEMVFIGCFFCSAMAFVLNLE